MSSYYMSDQMKIYLEAMGVTPEKVKSTAFVQKQGVETAAAVITAPFDIILWVKDNW